MDAGGGAVSLAEYNFQPLERPSKSEYAQLEAQSVRRIIRNNDTRTVLQLSHSMPYLDFDAFCGTRDQASAVNAAAAFRASESADCCCMHARGGAGEHVGGRGGHEVAGTGGAVCRWASGGAFRNTL